MNETLETYRHSGRFAPLGPVLCAAAAVLLGLPLGLAYAYLLRWIPFVYVNFILTLGYGFVFGWVTVRLLKATPMRNAGLAALCGFAVGLIALYCEWSAHVHVIFDDSPWVLTPAQVLRGMDILYQEGSWAFRSLTVKGIPLALIWLIEAGIIVGLATMMPFTTVADTPYCERSRCWLDEEKKIDTLASFTEPDDLDALKAGSLAPLVAAQPKMENAAVFTRLLLKRSPRCISFCTLRVQDVTLSIDKDGKVNEATKDHTGDLIIPASMFELISGFEEFKPLAPTAS